MKEFKEFVTEYYKTIGSVVVILAMVIACAVTLIQKRTANTEKSFFIRKPLKK